MWFKILLIITNAKNTLKQAQAKAQTVHALFSFSKKIIKLPIAQRTDRSRRKNGWKNKSTFHNLLDQLNVLFDTIVKDKQKRSGRFFRLQCLSLSFRLPLNTIGNNILPSKSQTFQKDACVLYIMPYTEVSLDHTSQRNV